MEECIAIHRVLAFQCPEQYFLKLNIHHALKILQQIVFLNGALNSSCPSLCELSEEIIYPSGSGDAPFPPSRTFNRK